MGSRVEFNFIYGGNVRSTDPANTPVSICGRLETLHQVEFALVSHRLEPRVTLQTWKKVFDKQNSIFIFSSLTFDKKFYF